MRRALQDLHKDWLASSQRYLDSLAVQVEGTWQLLNAAAATELAAGRQRLLKV